MAPSLDRLNDTQADFIRRFVLSVPEATGVEAARIDAPGGDLPEADTMSTAPLAGAISLVALQKARLGWDGERKRVAAELKKLEAAMVAAFKEADDARDMAGIATKVHGVLEVIDARLLDTLDAALTAPDAGARGALLSKSAGLVDQYLADLDGHPLIQLVEHNPFLRVNVTTGLRRALRGLRAELV
ncbi:hypothetical protein [Epibacterium sp. Ofav1-8]|uniref:hypothetical protein n=1 Tax=Epibacterium sp. Ofav1-8 TaxID=2917735 RepID=UPI001EF5A71C|nr:hypothetical protein [Epibacterium sp. Ofav1-8]MCG7624997.1 hypothetical protein [Epibacterium sp. Ofav1-8]